MSIAKQLISAAYPIPHDEGCHLDPYYGEDNFNSFIDAAICDDEDFDPDTVAPSCNCGADALNEMAERFLKSE